MTGWTLILYIILAPAITALVISAIGTGLVRRVLIKRAVLDVPNARSNHVIPTPRGGGIAIIVAIAASWLLISLMLPEYSRASSLPFMPYLLATATILAFVSWLDDVKEVSHLVRLAVQALAVVTGISLLPALPLNDILPVFVTVPLTFIAWVWFINLYNFMDGIDGITGIETISITIGAWLLIAFSPLSDAALGYVAATGAAALGFLIWNWSPARIFCGDVGSITLGFILGFFLLWLAGEGQLTSALLLPAYYVSDASFTLLRRMAKGEKFWLAHSEHCYQQAVRAGYNHKQVSLRIAAFNIIVIVLSFLNLMDILPDLAALGLGYGVSAVLMLHLARGKKSNRPL